MQTTPPEIDAVVTELCHRVNPDSVPVYVSVQPVKGAVHRDCYANVAKKIAQNGGTLEYGWAIWLAPKFMIEAEHHAVWVSPEGQRVDVSPRASEIKILFLPGAPPYNNKPIANIRRGLLDHPKMAEYLDIHQQLDGLREKNATPDGYLVLTPEMQALELKAGMLQAEMGFIPSTADMMHELSALRFDVRPGASRRRDLTPKQRAEERKRQKKKDKRKGKG